MSGQISLQGAIRFNGGGHLNHSIFWNNLCPKAQSGEPEGELLKVRAEEDSPKDACCYDISNHFFEGHREGLWLRGQDEGEAVCVDRGGAGFRLGVARVQQGDGEAPDRHLRKSGIAGGVVLL